MDDVLATGEVSNVGGVLPGSTVDAADLCRGSAERTKEGHGSPVFDALLRSWSLISMAVLMLLVAWWAYALEVEYRFLRRDCLIAWSVAGFGAIICLAGAMHYVDVALSTKNKEGLPWYWRGALEAKKRLLLLGELLSAGLLVAALGMMIFGVEIPGPAVRWWDQGWEPSSMSLRGR